MRISKCENRLCARAPGARSGSLAVEFGRKVFPLIVYYEKTLNMA